MLRTLYITLMDTSQKTEGSQFGRLRITLLLFADDVANLVSSRLPADTEAVSSLVCKISTSKSEVMVHSQGGSPSLGWSSLLPLELASE